MRPAATGANATLLERKYLIGNHKCTPALRTAACWWHGPEYVSMTQPGSVISKATRLLNMRRSTHSYRCIASTAYEQYQKPRQDGVNVEIIRDRNSCRRLSPSRNIGGLKGHFAIFDIFSNVVVRSSVDSGPRRRFPRAWSYERLA